MILKIKKLVKNVILPKYAHSGDAGLDLYSIENKTLKASTGYLFGIGLAAEIPKGYFGFIKERSSFGKLGVIVAGGVIDSGYRGEILVSLFNTGKKSINIKIGDKIAQLLIIPIASVKVEEVNRLSKTQRGIGGFGSTGRK